MLSKKKTIMPISLQPSSAAYRMTSCRNSVSCAVSSTVRWARKRAKFTLVFKAEYESHPPPLQTCHSAARNSILMLIAALHRQPRPALCTLCKLLSAGCSPRLWCILYGKLFSIQVYHFSPWKWAHLRRKNAYCVCTVWFKYLYCLLTQVVFEIGMQISD